MNTKMTDLTASNMNGGIYSFTDFAIPPVNVPTAITTVVGINVASNPVPNNAIHITAVARA